MTELFYFGGCPNYHPFLIHLRELLAQADVADPVRCARKASKDGPPDTWVLAALRRERLQRDARRMDQAGRRRSQPAERRGDGQDRVVPPPHGPGPGEDRVG